EHGSVLRILRPLDRRGKQLVLLQQLDGSFRPALGVCDKERPVTLAAAPADFGHPVGNPSMHLDRWLTPDAALSCSFRLIGRRTDSLRRSARNLSVRFDRLRALVNAKLAEACGSFQARLDVGPRGEQLRRRRQPVLRTQSRRRLLVATLDLLAQLLA